MCVTTELRRAQSQRQEQCLPASSVVAWLAAVEDEGADVVHGCHRTFVAGVAAAAIA